MFSLSSGIYSQEVSRDAFFDSESPSEKTYQKIEESSGIPNLRAKPDDIDDSEKPQKVSIGNGDFGNMLLMVFTLFIYTTYKTNKKRHKQA